MLEPEGDLKKYPTEETRRKMSLAHLGKKRPEISLLLKGNKNSQGRVLSVESRAKLSQSLKGNKNRVGTKHTLETRLQMSQSMKGKNKGKTPRLGSKHTPEAREKMRQANLGRKQSPETLRKKSEFMKGKPSIMKGKHHKPETKARLSQASKERWADPEYKDRVVRKMVESSFRRPTTLEMALTEILNEVLPNEYKYVGAKREVVIGGCAPDFININGKKKVIEGFGDYYHSSAKTGKAIEQEEIDKMNTYRAFGFDCLIIWEREVKENRDAVIKRIIAFHRQRHKKLEIQPCLL